MASFTPQPPSSAGRSVSHSPEPPPYSPITPEFKPASLVAAVVPSAPSSHATSGMYAAHEAPAVTPISESTNPDAIALRSALAILQIQRLRSLHDIQTLDSQRVTALADPKAFARSLAAGHIRSSSRAQDKLSQVAPLTNHEGDDADGPDFQSVLQTGPDQATPETFGTIPTPQDIVRCPPINWAKYHVSGDALDRLHDQQRSRPALDQPTRHPSDASHSIAAPYSPWTDSISQTESKSRDNLSR